MADYRYNKLASEKVAWNTSKGNKVEIEVSLNQEETDYFGNGDWQPTRGGLDITYSATIDGKNENVIGGLRSTGNAAIPYAIGRIGLITENHSKLTEAKSIVANHPAWQAKKAAEAESYRVENEYRDHTTRVENMMTLNGKSY